MGNLFCFLESISLFFLNDLNFFSEQENLFEKNCFMCTNKAIELLDNFYEGHKKIMALFP